MLSRIIIVSVLWLLVDLYFFQAIRVATQFKLLWWLYWLYDFVILALIVYVFLIARYGTPPPSYFGYWLFGLMLVSLVPKLLASPILLAEDIARISSYAYQGVKKVFSSSGEVHFAGRRKFVSQLALSVAAIPMGGLLYGMVRGRYNYQVKKVVLKFPDLPDAFHQFTITQLSDIHSGSFDSKQAVERGIAMANEQNSDLILFTGDLVNNKAEEMDQWISSFSRLQAPYGKFSVLGNHDYGDYHRWENESAKKNNFVRLLDNHKKVGFQLLNNKNTTIEKDGQQLSLIGVENWGKGRFPKYGDLDAAIEGVPEDAFKILMSHDPSHWEAKVLPHKFPVHLTLSGHTHGMQFGVEVKGYKWSPAKYMYPQWAGLYEQQAQYLYVNRGFGFIGYPGRIGILPEITVITLEKAEV